MPMRMPPISDNQIPPGDDWETKAACRALGNELFFPPEPITTDRAYERGKTFCRLCLVRNECLAMALKAEEQSNYRFGLFGGLTPKERERHVQREKSR